MRFLGRLSRLFVVANVVFGAVMALVRVLVRPSGGPDDNDVRVVSVFAGSSLRSRATALERIIAITCFGGTVIDLRRADTGLSNAHIDATTIFGGLEIVVPDTWAVEVTTVGVALKPSVAVPDRRDLPSDAPRLSITVRGVAAGVQIVARPVVQVA